MTARRFPAPWTVEEYRGISYFVRDADNFAVAYVYFAKASSGRPDDEGRGEKGRGRHRQVARVIAGHE